MINKVASLNKHPLEHMYINKGVLTGHLEQDILSVFLGKKHNMVPP